MPKTTVSLSVRARLNAKPETGMGSARGLRVSLGIAPVIPSPTIFRTLPLS